VTIAAGFRCNDGVVLCADTEMTIPGWINFPGTKIRMKFKLESRPVCTFAGAVPFCEMFAGKILGCIASAEKSKTNLLTAIEEETLKIHKRFSGEEYEAYSSLLLSLWAGKEAQSPRRLYEIGQGILAPVSSSCLGTGRSVGQGMVTELFRQDMSMKQGALMATYLLSEAKTYAEGCGKESQILLLSDNTGGLNRSVQHHLI